MRGARPRQRLGLLAFGVAFAALFLGFAIAQGIGRPDVPAGAVAVVEDAPAGMGTIARGDFDRAFAQVARAAGVKDAPHPGDPQYEELMEVAMDGLLSAVWLQGQAAEMGIALEPGRVIEEFKSVKAEEFKTKAEYEKFLRASLLDRGELIDRVEAQLLTAEIQKRLGEESPSPADEAEAEFLAEFTDKWASRTFCAAGFVTESCANFQATGRPPGAPSACYEAEPDGEAPPACPAPVMQAKPARPGSVSILEPEGEQLPQRPLPAD